MSKRFTFLFFITLNMVCYAQSDSLKIQTDQTIEDLFVEPDEEVDNSDLYELIEYYIQNPVNLNNASLKDLIALPYLDLSSAKLIIHHRDKYGKFFSKNELYSLRSIPKEVVKKILLFLSVAKTSSAGKVNEQSVSYSSINMRNRILYDLEQRKGFKDKIFEGSPYKIYNRLNVNYSKNIGAGFLSEKDAGERSYSDFFSGYLKISEVNNFKNILIGDYLVEFGQGLALWSPYHLSKGSDAIYSVKRKSRNIKPYTSASENKFFRGAAVEYDWEHLNIITFYSRNSLDANIDSISGLITSTPLDGFHRTNNEILKRKSVVERSSGISMNYEISSFFTASILYYTSKFDHSFYSSNIYDISGNNFNYYASYLDLFLMNFNVFGELSFDGKSVASLFGLKFSPSPEFTYTFLIRNYPYKYINLHGFSFGERSGALNSEFGIYNGFRWRTILGDLNFYFDQFKFPYATFSSPLPAIGNEIMVHFYSKPAKGIETNTRIKIENKELMETVNSEYIIVKRLKQSFRFEFMYTFSNSLRLKTRLEYSNSFIKDLSLSEQGYLLFEDLRISPVMDFILHLRIIFFKTNSFNSAIYEYENDLTGILSNVGLYGEGVRFYLVFRYKLLKKLFWSFKYSETYMPKVTSIGTGYQRIDGDLDSRVGLQLDFIF